MKKKAHKKHLVSIRILSVILTCCILSATVVSADELLDCGSSVYRIKSAEGWGSLQPVSAQAGSYVIGGANYNSDEWKITRRQGEYYTIKYFISQDPDLDFYLHMTNSADYSYITLGTLSDPSSIPNNYLWKVDVQGISAGPDFESEICTISNKADETKYLTMYNGYLAIITGDAGGTRASVTRQWLLQDLTSPYDELKIEHDGSSGGSNLRPISLACIYDECDEYGRNCYSGAYINGSATNVLQSCRNIGASKIYEYEGFNRRGIIGIIKKSSVCVITLHGASDKITLKAHPIGECVFSELTTQDLNELPDGYFSGTKCVLLTSCSTAAGEPNSFADVLQSKGVEAVVGFEEEIQRIPDPQGRLSPDEADQLFNQIFLQRLGVGYTVEQAADEAYKAVADNFGYESRRVVGNKNLVVNN